MAREILLVSTTNGIHHLEVGMNAEEIAGFSWQLWIEKFGLRYVDWCQSMGMGWVTFMGGDLWVQNSDLVARGNLYGEQKDYIVGVVTNENPTQVKVFDSLGIHSDGKWEVTSVIIPESLNYPDGMSSKIPKEQFKKRAGIWRARFLRNMKSTDNTLDVINALSGEPLRGYEAYMLLKNVENPAGEQVKLFKVQVEASSSRI